MFSYFESSVDGIIPNEYSSFDDIFSEMFGCIASVRDSCMLTARRCWLAKQQLVTPEFSKKIFQFSFSKDSTESKNKKLSTSTTTTTSNAFAQDIDASIKNRPPMNELSTKLTKSTDPAKQMPSANVNNSQILLNNFNNLNKRHKKNENKLILTNNENHNDGYYNEFSHANDTKPPQKIFTKKQK